MLRTRKNDIVSEFEDSIVLQAQYFTMFEMRGGERIRQEFWPEGDGLFALTNALRAAVAARSNSPRAAVYAVRADGRSVLISPQDYGHYITKLEALCSMSKPS